MPARVANSLLFNDFHRAGDGTRTRDIKLGRLALYQLSYSRKRTEHAEPTRRARRPAQWGLRRATCSIYGEGRIRTFEGLRRQIYSLISLAT